MAIIYCTTNKINGKKYIGSHNGNKSSYLGSGVNLTKAIKNQIGLNNLSKVLKSNQPLKGFYWKYKN
jgi:hypothetical protein